ncbi:hypothetical protein [Glycomyces tenuis]|uniref:hypothetical protein n=1 Tax=Glycomyces tenuis TaxID=58116 RepID=UPI0003FB3EF9|nr:hypothetical protein [Glycomyces tenuis]
MPAKDKRERKSDGTEADGKRRERTEAGAAIDRPSAEPDVYLDVPQVDVEELIVDVEDLRARVSLSVEVLDLVRLNVGADVVLGKVHLDLKGVHAQAMLKVRLDRVAEIVARVLETVDRNPQVLEQALSAVERTVEPVTESGGKAVEAAGKGAAGALERTGEGVGDAVHRTGEGVGEAVESVPETAENVADGEDGQDAKDGGRARKRQPGKRERTAKKAAKKAARKRTARKRSS